MSNPVPEGWKLDKVGKHITEFREKCKVENEYEVFTSSKSGLMRQSDYYGENRITRRSTIDFNVIPENYITYRSRSDNNQFTFNKNTLGCTGLISKYYPVFAHKDGEPYSQFLLYLINFYAGKFALESVGTSQLVLSMNAVQSVRLPFPPLPEQQKIAAILSTVDDVIEKTRAQINKLKDLKTGMMQELLTKGIGPGGVPHTEFKDSPVGRIPVGWEVKPLSELVSSIKSGLSRRIVSQDIGIPMLISGNIKNGKLDASDLKYWYIDDPQGANTSNYILNDGDILMCFINSMSQIGKSCIYSDIGRPAIYTTNMFRIIPKPEYSSEYLQLVFGTQRFQEEIQLISKPAVNQASFTKGELEQLWLPIPPDEERTAITNSVMAVVNKIDSLQSILEAKLCLKKALMQDLLTGKVRVNVDNKESAVA